jgi:hypothetical protein
VDKFDLQARIMMMNEHSQVIIDFFKEIVTYNEQAPQILAKIEAGDMFAFAAFLVNFEKREEQFRRLAEVISSFEHVR